MLHGRLLLLVFGFSLCAGSATDTNTSEDVLMAALLDGYFVNARPPPSNMATDVHIGFFLSSIDDVEERSLTMTVAGFIFVTWSDERLTWNRTTQNNLDRLVMPATSIWKPDLALTDSVGDIFNSVFYSDFYGITVLSTGNLTWTMQGSFTVRCDFNLTYYPFDTQTCDLRYESLNYPSNLLRLYTDTSSIDLSQYHENSEFAVVSTAATTEEFVPGVDGNYSNVIFTVTLKRRPLYFMLNLILPCVLLSVLTCFVFLLPAKSGERIGLAITLLLAFAVFQLQVGGYLPINSLTSTILTDFILTSMFFNCIALIATIFVLRISEKEDQPVPPWLEKLFVRKLGRYFGITSKIKTVSSEIQASASISDHLLLNVKTEDSSQGSSLTETTCKDGQLWQLVSSVKYIENFMKSRDHHHKQAEKWHIISKVCDIIMFLVFAVAVGLQCIGFLVLAPAKSS